MGQKDKAVHPVDTDGVGSVYEDESAGVEATFLT